MRWYIFIIVGFLFPSHLFSQKAEPIVKDRGWGLHLEFGMQGDIYKQIGVNGSFDYDKWDYKQASTSIANVFLDIGGVYAIKQWELGGAVRLALASKSLRGWDQELSIVPMPSIWAARYFGKYDKRGFRVGINFTPVFIQNYIPPWHVPDPNERIPPIGSSTTYWPFGATIGTRIFRKGWLKDTYINLNPQIAPPNPDDNLWLTEIGWYWRINAGLTKNIHFRK